MPKQIFLFILNMNDFDIKEVEANVGKFNLELNKSLKTYKEKLFSQFIRHYVFADFFKLPKLQFSINNSNKPYLENYSDKHFSISHSGNKIVMAVSSVDIGVDTEVIRSRKNINIVAKRYFSKHEATTLSSSTDVDREFYKLWTLKEAQVKRNAVGIAQGLANATFTFENNLWISENHPKDFVSYSFKNSIISLCCKNISSIEVKAFKLDNSFNFKNISNRLKSY